MTLRLVVGGKWSSSWTMRGWLACKLSGLPFAEETLFLSRPDSKARLAAASPTGRIPVLDHDGFLVTDTMAIAEYLWELAPASAIWPAERRARAAARAVAAEMHASFAALRAALPMNLVKRWPIAHGVPSNVKLLGRPGVAEEIAACRRHGARPVPPGALAGPICSGSASISPMPCTRRWQAASAPTPSRWRPRRRPMPMRRSPTPSCASGSLAPRPRRAPSAGRPAPPSP